MSVSNIITQLDGYIEHIYTTNSFDKTMVVGLTDDIMNAITAIEPNKSQTEYINKMLAKLLHYIELGDIVGIKDCLEFELKDFFTSI